VIEGPTEDKEINDIVAGAIEIKKDTIIIVDRPLGSEVDRGGLGGSKAHVGGIQKGD